MSIGFWIATYLAILLFWLWVVRWGGAERLEGSAITDWFDWLSSRLHADGIKVIGWLAIGLASAWFVAGLFVPSARFWW